MAIRGSLREASLPDVLQLLALGQKTGRLAVTDRTGFGYIYFEQGLITHAAVVNRPDRLGDLLLAHGLLSPRELAAVREEQRQRGAQGIGEILIERETPPREQVERLVRVQIEESVFFLFTWSRGTFLFEPAVHPEPGVVRAAINPEGLLLEGARRADEWALIEEEVPSLDLVFSAAPNDGTPSAADELSTEQRRLLPLLDGTRSVREAALAAGLVEFEAARALLGLVRTGLATSLGPAPDRVHAPAEPAVREQHFNLGVAFYRTGMLEEAAREFRRVEELQPGDPGAVFHRGLVALRAGDERAAIGHFKRLVEAGTGRAAAFQNLALALERMGRLDHALLAAQEAMRLQPRDPRVLLSHAILLLKNGRVQQAVDAFHRYRQALASGARPAASYFAFAVVAEAAAGRPDHARVLGQEGLALYPHTAPLILHVGAVRERAAEWEAAELLYRRAVEEEPALAQAHKSLGDALYRRGAHAEAEDAYRRALDLGPELGDDLFFKLGNLCYKRGARPEAVQFWRRALELNPEHAVARTNLELVDSILVDRPDDRG